MIRRAFVAKWIGFWVILLLFWIAMPQPPLFGSQSLAESALPFQLFLPTLSFDRDQIAFVSDKDGDLEIYLMNTDGSGVIQLTHNTVSDAGPSWSPDGEQLVFHSARDGYHQLYTMNADGSNQQRLLSSAYYDEWPFWSPGGSFIVFARIGNHNNDGIIRTELFITTAEGAPPSRLTFMTGETNGYGHSCWPSGWSADGSKIIYYCYIDGRDQLWWMNADGTNQQLLLDDGNWNAIPTLSPDGQSVAFSSYRDQDYEIYTFNINAQVPLRLTFAPGEDWRPVWSADGTRILFESDRTGQTHVFVMNADGSAQQRLTDNQAYAAQGVWRP